MHTEANVQRHTPKLPQAKTPLRKGLPTQKEDSEKMQKHATPEQG